jgi:agmatine deiminase
MAEPTPGLPFRMPAEWEPHEATWIAWPHRREDWPGKFATIPWVYTEIVRHLHRSETVRILVNDAAGERRARGLLKRAGVALDRVEFFHFPTDRVWTRDYGPLFVWQREWSEVPEYYGPTYFQADRVLVVADWHFNGWAKYPNWQQDDAVARQASEALGLPRWEPILEPPSDAWSALWGPPAADRRVVLEGGSIDVNGQGLLLTTEECLLSPVQARNPGLTREDLEKVFARYLGVHKVLWLGRGIAGDDTHGHVDDLARFVAPRTVVAVREDDPADVNYEPLRENWERLQGMTDLDGAALEVVALPMPSPVVFEGQRLPASYANFYIANECVLVPTFNDPNDRRALGILADLFPGRAVVGIHAVDLVWGLGTLHCLTQQQPRSGSAH